MALSRVTTIEGLYITDLCKNKIAVDPKVQEEMQKLRTKRSLQLCFTLLYDVNTSDLKVCHLNARSLHKHIKDIRSDLNYLASDIGIFTETRFSPFDDDEMYTINGFQPFRNDDMFNRNDNRRPYHGTAVYSKIPFVQGYPYSHNINGIEFTVIKVINHEDLTMIGVYRSPHVSLTHLCSALHDIVGENILQHNIIIGDFNVNWMVDTERQSLYNVMIRDNGYMQLITSYTTDNNTLIDHIYTNITNMEVDSGNIETYFSDHKAIRISCKRK